jgi:hypothetical protein
MSSKEKVSVEIQNFGLVAPEDPNAIVTYVSEIFSLCGYKFR